jgi:hypothetical protein
MRRVPDRRSVRVSDHQASELSPTSPESPRRDHACGSGPVGAGPARERERSSRQDPRDLCSGVRCSVSETRCNGGAFRDRSSHPWPLLVWPSLAKQLPPGTTIAPLTRQRNRHGSETSPGPFYETLAANFPRSAGIGWARPGPCLARDGQTPSLHGRTRGVSWTGPPDPGAGFLERKVSGILRGNLCRVAKATLSRAGPAPTSSLPQGISQSPSLTEVNIKSRPSRGKDGR